MKNLRYWLALLMLQAPLVAFASQGAAQQGVPPAPPVSTGGLLQVLLGLAIVLAAIAVTAWILKRMAPGQVAAGGAMRVIGGVALGTRERLVLVEVGETWLVVGVAPGQVNAVHAMPKPAGALIPDVAVNGAPGFQDWLKKALQSRQGSGK